MSDYHCNYCGALAACIGSYDMGPIAFACDRCCAHGCEDGHCESLNETSERIAETLIGPGDAGGDRGRL